MTEIELATADIIQHGQWDEEYIRHRIIKAFNVELRRLSREAEKWTKRCDDAKRIPDWLHDQAIDIK